MKALSIMQPWAWSIVRPDIFTGLRGQAYEDHAIKPVENRDWRDNNPGLKFRGKFLIHTGKKFDPDFSPDGLPMIPWPAMHEYPMGGIIGVGEIIDVVKDHSSPWFFGPYGLVIQNARPTKFVPWKGQLGFFDIPDDVALQAMAS